MNKNEAMRITQEECAEVIQAISKVFRFGIDGVHEGKTNRESLTEEVGDLLCMINLLTESGILDETKVKFCSLKKREKLEKWSNVFDREFDLQEFREFGVL